MDPEVIAAHVRHVKAGFMFGEPVIPIVVGVAAAYFVGAFGFGFWWSLWLVPLFLFWEMKSMDFRLRLAIKDFIWSRRSEREPGKESVDWMNATMAHVWVAYADYIKQMIYEKSAEPLEKNKPGFLTKLCIENVDLGDYAPCLSEFVVHHTGIPNKLVMDCTMNFQSGISVDVAAYKGATRLPVIVKNPYVAARVRVTAWMIGQEPFVSKVRLTMLDRPKFDISIRVLNHGPDLMAIPGLSAVATSLAFDILDNIVGHPNYVDIDVAPQFFMDDDLWPLEEKKKADNLLMSGIKGITGGVGAVGGAAVGAVGAAGGLVVDGVGAVGGAAVGAVGDAADMVGDVMGSVSGVFGFGKKKSKK